MSHSWIREIYPRMPASLLSYLRVFLSNYAKFDAFIPASLCKLFVNDQHKVCHTCWGIFTSRFSPGVGIIFSFLSTLDSFCFRAVTMHGRGSCVVCCLCPGQEDIWGCSFLILVLLLCWIFTWRIIMTLSFLKQSFYGSFVLQCRILLYLPLFPTHG